MRIDALLPTYEFRSRHQVIVRASLGHTYKAVLATNFRSSRLVGALLWLRGFREHELPARGLRETLRQSHFVELSVAPEEEIVFGLVCRPWRPDGGRCAVFAWEFDPFAQKGYAKIAWNFELHAKDPETTHLSTETRVHTLGSSAYWKFRAYWLLVAPFSGLIRRATLLQVKRAAENTHLDTPPPVA